MLLRLLPDQIARYWEIFKESILATVPPIPAQSPETLNNMLSALLAGIAQAWVTYRKEDDKVLVIGFVITNIIYDEVTNTQSLYLQSVYVPNDNSIAQDWVEGLAAVMKFAEANNCSRVLCHTNNPKLMDWAKKFGGECDYVLCSWALK
jgi:hypothetical protein